MTDDRNYPSELNKLDRLPDELLQQWAEKGEHTPMRRAADEINFSRFWLEKMNHDIWAGDRLVAKSLKSYQTMTALLGEVHGRLVELLTDADPTGLGVREKIGSEDIQELITKIETVFRATIKPHEG